MVAKSSLLLFTDLDGTLLDHHSYDWLAAEPALARLKALEIPVIINTSKTLAESLSIQQQLNIRGPVIIENGAGVALPVAEWPEVEGEVGELVGGEQYWLKSLAMPYADVRNVLNDLRRKHDYKFLGFADMDAAQVADCTGLGTEEVINAMDRRFDEPLIWQDSPARLEEFAVAVSEAGLTHTQGGRFLHVMGHANKGKAMRWLVDQLPAPHPQLVALGDSDNDIPMLSQADIAVLVRSPTHDLPSFPCNQRPPIVVVTGAYGPKGWNNAVLQILEEFTHG